jgi:hypothetical protein
MYLSIRLLVVSAILFCLSVPLTVGAETYHWVDEQGIMHFSDNPPSQSRAKRNKVQVREDITNSNPGVREAVKESQSRVSGTVRDEQEKAARQRRLREAGEEQERKIYQARDKRLKEEQIKREQQEARELKRRLDTTPVQRSAEELGGFSLSSGST